MDWSERLTGPIVVILHGLEGSSHSPYARGLLSTLSHVGMRAVVMHFRGCSGAPNRLPRSYHSGDTADFAYLVAVLQQREPTTPLACVGYSLGGNVLLKWLGEAGSAAPLQAAVAVSVPFLLAQAADRMHRGFSRLYEWKLLRSMRHAVERKRELMTLSIDAGKLRTLRSFRDFDDHVTAPLHGFKSAAHYYATASSRPYLRSIAIDTLILHARDDPFMTETAIPDPTEISSKVELEIYNRGGHVGFVTGAWPWGAHYWLEERIPRYLQQQITTEG